jgi:hypothetical protein
MNSFTKTVDSANAAADAAASAGLTSCACGPGCKCGFNIVRLRTGLQVRFDVPVPARRDLLAGVQVRRLTVGAFRPGRSQSGSDDLH